MIFSLAWNIMLLITKTFSFWIFWRWQIRSCFSQNIDGNMIISDRWKVLIFGHFANGEIRSFSRQKVDGKMIFTDYWKGLVLNYWNVFVLVFFVIKMRYVFSQKVGAKMIFTWSFWAFHDIPALGKYGFLCSDLF